MTNALTLTEAAERLAPVFTEETGSSSSAVATRPKGKWMSLEHAGDILSQRVTGQRAVSRKEKPEVTVAEAGKQIERVKPETPGDLSEIRAQRSLATTTKLQRLAELQDYISRAALPFEGMDEMTALASPEFMVVYGYGQQLRSAYDQAVLYEFSVWDQQWRVENEMFEAGRPNWSNDDVRNVVAMLTDFGVSQQELDSLWLTPSPINVRSPACVAVAQMATGTGDDSAIQLALGSVGFDQDEIHAAISGEMPVFLRDHRIQELVARAADAYTPAKNRAAA